MKTKPSDLKTFQSFCQIVSSLRDPNGGCPWDLEQNHLSLRKYALEEVYELVDAIESENIQNLKEELGDVLLQVVLHAEIASQNNHFSIEDVIESISSKMIRRHPHVFKTDEIKTSSEVLKEWEKIKDSEQEVAGTKKAFFDFPKALPALIQSDKIGLKSNKVGFDWDTKEQVMLKVDEELLETKEAILTNDIKKIEDEIGDLLFVVSQLARHYDIDSERALKKANNKFIKRFQKMLEIGNIDKYTFANLSLDKKEDLWKKAKKALGS